MLIGNEKLQKTRVGKLDAKGEGKDGKHSENEGRSKVEVFWAYGELTSHLKGDLAARLAYMKEVEVLVHYELYNNQPIFSKWITVNNYAQKSIIVNSFKSEQLAVFEPESAVDYRESWLRPNITVETDYNFGGMSEDYIYASSLTWKNDPLYTTQVHYERETPCLLEVARKLVPSKQLKKVLNSKVIAYGSY